MEIECQLATAFTTNALAICAFLKLFGYATWCPVLLHVCGEDQF